MELLLELDLEVIMKRRFRFVRCIWHDVVDLLMLASTIGLFVYSFFGHDVSRFLWVLIFYIYYFMYRKFTFWQDRAKMYRYIKSLAKSPESVLAEDDL